MPSLTPDSLNTPSLEAFLLGHIDFDQAVEFQRLLVEQVRERDDGQIVLLLCEHPTVITVGRGGMPSDVASQNSLIRTRQIAVRWINRGGGCLVHATGQLAIYPIVPLRWHGLTVGDFMLRLQTGIHQALLDLNVRSSHLWKDRPAGLTCPSESSPSSASNDPIDRFGIWGRTGQLASLGVAVRHWITYFGAYLNVSPATGLLRLVQSDPAAKTPMSSLVAERCGGIRMPSVRAALVHRLAEQFGCDRYHLYTGHPMLRKKASQRTPLR